MRLPSCYNPHHVSKCRLPFGHPSRCCFAFGAGEWQPPTIWAKIFLQNKIIFQVTNFRISHIQKVHMHHFVWSLKVCIGQRPNNSFSRSRNDTMQATLHEFLNILFQTRPFELPSNMPRMTSFPLRSPLLQWPSIITLHLDSLSYWKGDSPAGLFYKFPHPMSRLLRPYLVQYQEVMAPIYRTALLLNNFPWTKVSKSLKYFSASIYVLDHEVKSGKKYCPTMNIW